MEYSISLLESVNNRSCIFYKLSVNGKCQYDDFEEEVQKNAVDRKSLKSILAYMDCYSPDLSLPDKLFRHIQSNKRSDIYEFKKNRIRVYVILKSPKVFVVLGGYKHNQERDIAKINRDLVDFLAEQFDYNH